LKNLFNNHKISHVAPDGTAATTYTLAAGTSEVDTASVDRKGYESVAFLVTFGDNADTGVISFKLQHSADNVTFTDAVDKDGNTIVKSVTAGATSTDHYLTGIEAVGTKLKRYVRLAITRETANTAIAALHAVLSNPQDAPVTQAVTAGQFVAQPTLTHVCG
jgi:hypothetical protein